MTNPKMTRNEAIAAFQAAHPWCMDPTIPGDCYDLHQIDGVPWCDECADWHHTGEGHSQP